MAKNHLVVKDNALIYASYNLELVELRLVLLAIVEARATGKGITPNDSLTVTASSYMNNFNTSRNTAYQALKDACNHLFERQFSYTESNQKGNLEKVRSRWVSEVRYIENEASVKLIFSPTVVPMVTLLEKNFTSYELEQIAELNSKYAVRLYELATSWRSLGKTPIMTIEEIRECLGILEGEYQRIEALKRRVLDFSVQQINQHTNINLNYEQHKQGRKIIGFAFTIQQKQTKTKEKTNIYPLDPEEMAGLNDIEKAIVQNKLAYAKKQKITDIVHIKNLVNKALKKHREETQDSTARSKIKAQQQKEQDDKKQNKLKLQEEKEKQNKMVAYFESLPIKEQEKIMDLVEQEIAKVSPTYALGEFKDERKKKQNPHHKPWYAIYFYKVIEVDFD